MSIDVAINVYGKPFQTAVTLLSLVKHSGDYINKIFFVMEAKQPEYNDFSFLTDILADKIVIHTPKHWLWIDPPNRSRLTDDEYRRSIRYQLAWEDSDADHLFITHNDVLYRGDVLGVLAQNIGGFIGIGQVGQCWNCPAAAAKVCNGDSYLEFQPTFEEARRLYEQFPSPRHNSLQALDQHRPWPLPECRLNEWVALVDMKKARPETIPLGDAFPFGAISLDIGTEWFRDMSHRGFRFRNFSIEDLATHGWADDARAGHPALFDFDRYEKGEAIARSVLINDFGLQASVLDGLKGSRWYSRLRTKLRRIRN